MSKPRIEISLVVDTQAHADLIKDALGLQFRDKQKFETEHEKNNLSISEGENKEIIVQADYRLEEKTDRDLINSFVKDLVSNDLTVKNWILKGSKISVHQCSHNDAEVKPCTETEYSVEFER